MGLQLQLHLPPQHLSRSLVGVHAEGHLLQQWQQHPQQQRLHQRQQQ
jgi:hypothetical protein